MFVGKYDVRLDTKNRVIVPQRLRESHREGGPLWSSFFLTLGAEGCIFVYTSEGWERLMEEMGAPISFSILSQRNTTLLSGGSPLRNIVLPSFIAA